MEESPLLAIDIGNTRTKFALFLGEEIIFKNNIPSGISSSLFEEIKEEPSIICIASVVPKANSAIIKKAKALGITPTFVSYNNKIKTTIKHPEKIGADRIANVLGALSQYKPPIIIVDLGTATVFDVIDKDGIYIGGCILPGIEISVSVLFEKCALLEEIKIEKPKSYIGDDTKSAIQSGIFYGFIEQIDGMIRRIKRKMEGARVIGTGGINLFLSHLKEIDLIDPDLTLKGIRHYSLQQQNFPFFVNLDF